MVKVDINKENREKIISLLQEELREEYDCHLGRLDIDRFLDTIFNIIGPHIHNEAIDSMLKALKYYNDNLEEELDLLKIYE